MNIRKHFMERWVERVLGMSTLTEREVTQYIIKNCDALNKDVLDAFKSSEYIWQGQASPTLPALSNFFLFGDIVMIADTHKKELITCYRVELPLPPKIVEGVIDKSVNEILKRKRRISRYNDRWIPWFQKQNDTLEDIDAQMAALQERKGQIQEQVKEKRQYRDRLTAEIDEYAKVLVNSQRVSQDIRQGVLS